MIVEFTPEAKLAFLSWLRSRIDAGDGGQVQVRDVRGDVLLRIKLPRPCAPDPIDGAMACYEAGGEIAPDGNGVAARAFIVADGLDFVEIDVGKDGSGSAVELSKLALDVEDIVRAKTRLIFQF